MASTIKRCQSVVSAHMSPPSWTSPQPSLHPTPLSCPRGPAEVPVLCNSFPLVIYFAYGNVYVPMQLSQFAPPSPSHIAPKVCCLSSPLFLPCKYVHHYHFSWYTILVFLFLTYSTLYNGSRFISTTRTDSSKPPFCPQMSTKIVKPTQHGSWGWCLLVQHLRLLIWREARKEDKESQDVGPKLSSYHPTSVLCLYYMHWGLPLLSRTIISHFNNHPPGASVQSSVELYCAHLPSPYFSWSG